MTLTKLNSLNGFVWNVFCLPTDDFGLKTRFSWVRLGSFWAGGES